MKFGDKLKALRNDKAWTQPELAEAIGIEQSYLSKLENDKSLPSNDMFVRILEVFALDVGDLVDDLEQSNKNQLRQLPEVADYFHRQKQLIIGNRRRWMLSSAALLALGAALIYAGSVHLFFSDIVYQYISRGVVLEGESKEIFENPHMTIPDSIEQKQRVAFMDSIKARIDEEFVLASDFRGDVYNIGVKGGSRTFYLRDVTEIDPWQSKLVVFLGVLMAMFGLIGLILEKKLSRYH